MLWRERGRCRMKIEKLTVNEVMKRKSYEGIVVGTPTGIYADRDSYGNAPMLAFILDRRLPCKFRANPYSHRTQVEDKIEDAQLPFLGINFFPDDENENLGLAAAFIDQAIREKSEVEVHGEYKDNILYGRYLRVSNFGFDLPGYKFVFERWEEEDEG